MRGARMSATQSRSLYYTRRSEERRNICYNVRMAKTEHKSSRSLRIGPSVSVVGVSIVILTTVCVLLGLWGIMALTRFLLG